ncbi:MAG: hypothetical protein K2L55_10525 [Muribaculaceae bacterium]|nr:hypothetical protein [Muribaculaceae bacterium]
MDKQDYVSYPLALTLKKAGFDELCRYYYNPKGMLRKAKDNALSPEVLNNRYLDEIADGLCSAVPLWQAQKWLREEWGIHINVCIYSDYSTDADYNVCDRWDFWGFDLYVVVGGKKLTDDDGEYDSYEQALSAGIAAALELIDTTN